MKNKPFLHLLRTHSSACAVTLMLSGCVSIPSLHEQHTDALHPATPNLTVSATQAGILNDTPMPSQWWRLFNDPLLSSLEAETAGNLDLRAAMVRIEESRAQLGLVRADRQPQLNLNAGYTRSAISENSPLHDLGAPTFGFNTWSLGLQAGWELDLWGHLRQMEASARARLDAAWYGQEAVRVSVSAELARTYLLLRGMQAQIDLQQDNRRIAQDLVRLADSRERNGTATRHDAAAARAELAGIEARLAQLQHERDTLMNALALLLGRRPHELNDRLTASAMPAMPSSLLIGMSSELARNRPDIRQAQARLQAALADIGAAQADFYPRIGLGVGLGVQAYRLEDLGSWASRQYSVGPTLYLPIFQGGRLKQNLALSEARHQLAAIEYQQTVLRAWHEVDDALGAYASERTRAEQLQLALTQNQVALDVAQHAYQEGTTDFTTVLVAQRALLSSRAELVNSATTSALSVVSLYRALGGGWSAELQPLIAARTGVRS